MSQALGLTRPMVAFDIESTGLDTRRDRIIELSCVKMFPDRTREILTRRINPEQPISPEATEVHRISDADVASSPPFRAVAEIFYRFLSGCDLTGFNIESFDIPMLREEFSRCEMRFPEGRVNVVDSCRIFHRHEPRHLQAAVQFYCGKEHTDAHSAEADALASADILLAQVLRYDDLPADASGLDAYCHPIQPNWVDADGKLIWRESEACLGFGKHRNRALRVMAIEEPDYLAWISQANFSDKVRTVCRQALAGEFPRQGDDASERTETRL